MSHFQFRREQFIQTDIESIWDFASSPKNLKEITPDYMSFDITAKDLPEKMYPGMIISYKVSPLFNIKMNWVTEITHVKNLEYFVDEQRFGPYSFWHHKHFIKEIKGGVEMVDILDYALPFGILGRIFHPVIVRPKLNEIFNHRREKLIKIFGNF